MGCSRRTCMMAGACVRTVAARISTLTQERARIHQNKGRTRISFPPCSAQPPNTPLWTLRCFFLLFLYAAAYGSKRTRGGGRTTATKTKSASQADHQGDECKNGSAPDRHGAAGGIVRGGWRGRLPCRRSGIRSGRSSRSRGGTDSEGERTFVGVAKIGR